METSNEYFKHVGGILTYHDFVKSKLSFIQCIGFLLKLYNKDFTIEYDEYRFQKWVKICDWRWNNATLMCGSFQKVQLWRKMQVHDFCFERIKDFDVNINRALKALNNNNFGWHK